MSSRIVKSMILSAAMLVSFILGVHAAADLLGAS